jgi:hypothetical protein
VDHHDLTDHVKDTIFLLANCRELPVCVGAAKAGIVKTLNHNWRLSWKAGAVGGHLGQDLRDRISGEDPPVSVMIPRVAAELASLSALLAPMKRAAMSSTAGAEPGGKIVGSLERLGRVSKFSLKSVLSPSRRGVRRAFSS